MAVKVSGTDKTTLCEHHCEQSHRRNQPVSEIPGERLEDELCTRPEEQLYRGIQGVPLREEYDRLLDACRADERLYLAVETLCSTGIRIGELKYIRAEELDSRSVTVLFKGKLRKIFLPDLLVECLTEYCGNRGIKEGPVFITRTGRPLDRSNLWRSMKRAGKRAGLEGTKVYPHNLRHLFAAVFYDQEKDILKLADIPGHSNIETTRRYLAASGKEHRKKINEMNLVK